MMSSILRWGVLGVAKIAVTKVIPGMQKSGRANVAAIASRDLARAQDAAQRLGIPRAYGSYEELIADPEIDAIYNPLPNHLHVPWTARAAEAGKHVLCEKPLALNADEAATLIAVRDRYDVQLAEAFMVRTHPLWLRVRELIADGAIGQPRAFFSAFSYCNRDPRNIRNIPEYGGGALLDIGCYPINVSRFVFGREPVRVSALMDRDPDTRTDRLTSALLDYGDVQALFTCGTQLVPFQTVQLLGTAARIEIEIPYNIPPDRSTRIRIDDGRELAGAGARTEEFPICDQYTTQVDAFARAALDGAPLPVSVEDAVANMRVIDAIVRAGASENWERP